MDELEERERRLAAKRGESTVKYKETAKPSPKYNKNASIRAELERELNGNSSKKEYKKRDVYEEMPYLEKKDNTYSKKVAVVEEKINRKSWEQPLEIRKKVTPTTVKNSNKFKQLLIIAQRNVSK